MTARDGSLPHEGGGQEDKGVRTQEQTPGRGVGVFCQSKMPRTLRVKCAESHCWGLGWWLILAGGTSHQPTWSLS